MLTQIEDHNRNDRVIIFLQLGRSSDSQFPIQQIIKHTLRNTVCTVKKINQSSHRQTYKYSSDYSRQTDIFNLLPVRSKMMDGLLASAALLTTLDKKLLSKKWRSDPPWILGFTTRSDSKSQIALHQRTHF